MVAPAYGRSGFRRAKISALLALAIAAQPVAAFAQSDDERAGARVAATEGVRAFHEQRWADAVDLFTRAESLVHAPPHLLYMARSLAQLGQLVKARETFLKLIKETIPENAPKAFHDAQATAKDEVGPLEGRIPQVTVKVDGANGKPISVTVDGTKIPPALVGLPKPTDPGEHKYQATAEGLASEVTTLVLKEGAREVVPLQLVAAAAVPAVGATSPGAAGAAAPTDAGASAPDAAGKEQPGQGGGSKGLMYASFASFGVGAIGLGLGVFSVLKSSSKRSDADALCPGTTHCPNANKEQINALDAESESAKQTATIGFIVGGVGVAGGAMLYWLYSRPKTIASEPRVTPWVGLGQAGVSGSF
jgi:hypothetical protein